MVRTRLVFAKTVTYHDHETTGQALFHVIFGHSPVLPVKICKYPKRVFSTGISALPKPLSENCLFHVRGSIKTTQQHNKARYDHHATITASSIGYQVWLYNPAVKIKKLRCFLLAWSIYHHRQAEPNLLSNLAARHSQ